MDQKDLAYVHPAWRTGPIAELHHQRLRTEPQEADETLIFQSLVFPARQIYGASVQLCGGGGGVSSVGAGGPGPVLVQRS